MENSVREFASEQSNADYAAIVKRLGPPEKIAESYVLEMDAAELLGGIKLHTRILHILMTAVIAVVLIWFGFSAAAYYDFTKYEDGYAVVEVIEIDRTEEEG